MPSDNVDIFKKIIFSLPSARRTAVIIVLMGFIYSGLAYLSFRIFSPLESQLAIIPVAAVTGSILPAILQGELLYRFIPEYPRKWGYFLAASNQLVFFSYSLITSGADTFVNGWNVFWIALITVYGSSLLVLLLTLGYRYLKRIAILSLVQPLLILAAFHLLIGAFLELSPGIYMANTGLLVLTAVIIFLGIAIPEYLLNANVSNVSVLGLTSALLQKKPESLDLGYDTRPVVQSLGIANQEAELEVSIPWIHPGPLEGFGGGRITSSIIERLNRDGEGFFLHVPSTHASDPANPSAAGKILDAMEEPEKVDEASRMISRDYGKTTFYGRRFNGQNIVFMDCRAYDDYESSIFDPFMGKGDTAIVDLHCHKMDSTSREMFHGTERAEELRENLRDFLETLKDEDTGKYRAGFAVDTVETPVMALVEEVDGQKTLIFGLEGNEASRELIDLREEMENFYDRVLLFSTDTHRSIHDMASPEQANTDRLEDVIELAEKNVSKASIGLSSRKAETMKILKQDYLSLIFSINILVRLTPLLLLIFYVLLVIWIF